ncbi:PREDICTED: putative F-box protein At1g47790 [Ipomoea nil]|uniref:putative F-box protein At1g47790 n=1 Tax=Ipomoea nil TaxID=35883 RepID=UPI0009011FE6|nr:PREDICTED: putative F-box protein At1g47790 [Ipomoea nil]
MGVSKLPFLFLPKDILVEILSKLPAKSLVRLRCVSKFFSALIADHGFGVLHRSLSLKLPNRAGILIVIIPRTPYHSRSTPVFYTINFSEKNPQQLQANRARYLDGQPYVVDHLRSSSDGLVCLHKNNSYVDVCNVSTGQRISLPRIPFHVESPCALLGFDSESKRYKVLMSASTSIDRVNGRRDGTIFFKYKHWVLTVGVDKSWREINNNNSNSHLLYTFDGYRCANYWASFWANYSDTSVYIDGVIYSYKCNWLTKVHPLSFGIVAFEVGSESFFEIPLPNEISLQYYYTHAFGLLQVDGGRLAIVLVFEISSSYMGVWTWEKFKKCWEKIITIIPYRIDEVRALRFTTNHAGEIVLLSINSKQLSILVYNLKSKVWRKFDVGGVEEFPIFCHSDVRMYRTMDNMFSLE